MRYGVAGDTSSFFFSVHIKVIVRKKRFQLIYGSIGLGVLAANFKILNVKACVKFRLKFSTGLTGILFTVWSPNLIKIGVQQPSKIQEIPIWYVLYRVFKKCPSIPAFCLYFLVCRLCTNCVGLQSGFEADGTTLNLVTAAE